MSRELPRLERGGRLKEGALNEEGQQEAQARESGLENRFRVGEIRLDPLTLIKEFEKFIKTRNGQFQGQNIPKK